MEEGFNCISTSIAIKIYHGFIKYQNFTIGVIPLHCFHMSLWILH